MKCYECGGPCRKSDTKMVGGRIGRGGRAERRVCDFCRYVFDIDAQMAYIANVLREEIRKVKP